MSKKLGKIYNEQEIENAKSSPSFEREYNLKYLGLIGNVFHTKDIDAAIQRGNGYDPSVINKYAKKSMGIDPGFGSSPFGIVITQFVDEQIQILYAEEFERPDFNEMIDRVSRLAHRYGFTLQNSKILVDGANPAVIRAVKHSIGEESNYEEAIERYKAMGFDYVQSMIVLPVNFNQEAKTMLVHAKQLLEDENFIAISPKFDKLITSLRTAVEEDGKLDKEATSFNDIFDAYRLSLKYYILKG